VLKFTLCAIISRVYLLNEDYISFVSLCSAQVKLGHTSCSVTSGSTDVILTSQLLEYDDECHLFLTFNSDV
jgi:hypothetical protein